jgi:hypothetical protein
MKYTLNIEAAGLSATFVTTFKTAWWYNPKDIALNFATIKNSNSFVLRMLFDV